MEEEFFQRRPVQLKPPVFHAILFHLLKKCRQRKAGSRLQLVVVVCFDECAELPERCGAPLGGWVFCDDDRFFVRKHVDQLVRRPRGDDFAVVDNGDARAEPLGFFHVVCRVDNGFPLCVEGFQIIEDGIAGLRVDTDGRLVAQQDVRVVEEAGDDVEPAFHPPREGFHAVVPPVVQSHGVQSFVDPFFQEFVREAEQGTEHFEVGAGAQLVVERNGLGDEADGFSDIQVVPGNLLAPDGDRAVLRVKVADEQVHECGFARAVRSEQPEEFLFPDLERNVIERGNGGKFFCDMPDVNHGLQYR